MFNNVQQLFGALSEEKTTYPYLNKTFSWDLVLYAGASNKGLVEDGVEDISGGRFDCGVLKQDETSGADWLGVSIGIGWVALGVSPVGRSVGMSDKGTCSRLSAVVSKPFLPLCEQGHVLKVLMRYLLIMRRIICQCGCNCPC